MSSERIADEEILYRRIPPGDKWLEPPDRITSANFKLRTSEDGTKEEGLSVYRASIVTPAEVLEKPNAIPGSRIACAEAGKIRALQGGDKKPGHKKPLHLDVVIVNDEDDPGHAEIRGPEAGKALPKRFAGFEETLSVAQRPIANGKFFETVAR